jgi:hypothetical protein
MNPVRILFKRSLFFLATLEFLCLLGAMHSAAQSVPYARNFTKSKDEVDAALKDIQAYSGQKLPITDGFVAAGDKQLDRLERAFYQFTIESVARSSGGTIVTVSAKITAWYRDRDPAKSGYQVLTSNGRLEMDLLDRLGERLGETSPSPLARPLPAPMISAPKPKLDLGGIPGSAASNGSGTNSASSSSNDEVSQLREKRLAQEKQMQELDQEARSLEEVKKNQSHPKNLVVVKKAGTPVFSRPAEDSRALFSAAAEDEFEFIEAEGEFIHVQISGASRGYVRKSSVELPELIAERLHAAGAVAAKAAPFNVVREENSVFPGDWMPLRGKTVKLYTVQPVSQDPKETGARAKLLFAISLFKKFSEENPTAGTPPEGVVIIFDSADGGILGATLPDVNHLADGSLSSDIFWKQAYLDPPDAFQPMPKH